MEYNIINQYEGFLKTFPLWEGTGAFEIEQFKLPTINQTLKNREAIPGLSNNFVLGKRIERFFSFSISQSVEYNLIAENVQIVKNKITIGEIDFIVQNIENQEKIHVELVYKFYLYDPSFQHETDRWIGPNRKDSLSRKLEKLKKKQLPLIYDPGSTRYLNSLNINCLDLKQEVCFKAHLFVPYHMRDNFLPLINNSCISGYYLNYTEFSKKEYQWNAFYAPKKADWPIDPGNNEEWFSFFKILSRILELNKMKISPLVWMKTPEGLFQRFFVVWW